jgi:hypothetical protein
MGKPAPIRGNLSDVRVIMRVLMVKSLCQAAMGQVPVVECLLPGTRGCLWLHPVMLGTKWHSFARIQLQRLYPGFIAVTRGYNG